MSKEEATDEHPSNLVVVGSSAGGIEALSILVSTLPKEFPAPIVLAQHLDPSRPSNLGPILERRSTLPIVIVSDETPLEPGKVYVVPSNRHVSIHDGTVKFESDHADRPRPSVDLLLSSAAESYGERLIAVILTGTGSDGAAGAVEVKSAGGTVIIQNPATARYPAMPLALPPTAVDQVADIEQIGGLLQDFVKGVKLSEEVEESQVALREILKAVSLHTHIDFTPYKHSTIYRRISRRMTVIHCRALEEYAEYLNIHPEEIAELVMALLIKVTEFFRDPEAFAYLKKDVLPALIEEGRRRGRVLRLWSAGCATGEEPYSLAFLLADLLGNELPEWSIKIFATDLDEEAISFARRGLYPENILRNLPDDYRARFFTPADHGFHISKAIRQIVIFGQQDLSRGTPFPRIDLVVCRNLLIYFKPELQQNVMDLFAYSLYQVNGYIFLGKAETARPSKSNYEIVNKKWKIYRCTNGPLPGRINHDNEVFVPGNSSKRRNPSQSRPTAERPALNQDSLSSDIAYLQLRRFNELVLRYLPIGTAIIDAEYRLLTANGTARRLLGIREAAVDQDFLHAIHGLPYGVLRSAIDRVFHERTTILLPDIELRDQIGSEGRYVSVSIAIMQMESGTADMALVTAIDSTETVQTRRRLEAMQAEQHQLVEELTANNRRLNEMNKELQDANEALQAANEELMLTQEELQATNEEFEATNEELQATNEELETSNEELQATNEELETTNEELNARSGELQETSRHLADERVRLIEMIELAPFYILILRGSTLVIEAFNHLFQSLLGGQEVLGHPLDDAAQGSDIIRLADLAREAYRQDEIMTAPRLLTHLYEQEKAQEVYFDYTVVPIHDNTGKVDGVVIYAEDVTRQMASEALKRREKLKLMVENAHQVAIAIYDAETKELLQASPRYLEIIERACGLERDRITGRLWHETAFIAPEGEADKLFESVKKTREPLRLREIHINLTTEDREIILDSSLAPIPFTDGKEEGEVRFIVVTAVEVTEHIRARQELERLDRLKDDFISMASHELRTPLVPLSGYTDILAAIAEEKEKQEDPVWDKRIGGYVGKLRKQINHINRMVEDLFDVSRLETGKLSLERKRVDVVKLLEQALEECEILSPGRKIDFEIKEKDKPLIVLGDEQRILQVVMNLCENAFKYAYDDKPVEIRAKRVRETGESETPVERVRIEVQDYGRGIAEKELDSIFNRFYQAPGRHRTSRGGIGMGLYISRAIVEQHGGRLTARSALGKGSTFTILLPLAKGEA